MEFNYSCISFNWNNFSIIGLPAALSPDKTLYKDLGLEGMSIYNQLNSMPVKVFTVLNVLLQLLL